MIRAALPALTALGLLAAASPAAAQSIGSCGYQVETGTYTTWPGGYQAWVELTNESGEVATDFSLLVDVGDTTITQGHLAEYSAADGGYQVDAPSWLQWQTIPQGASYRAQFNGAGAYTGATAYVLSINGTSCDTTPPSVALSASAGFVTSEGSFTLTAHASDDVAVRKVVFKQNGVVIGEDREAPYSLDVPVTAALNGRQQYTATAVDPNGNEADDSESVLIAIGNRYVGTAVRGADEIVRIRDVWVTPEARELGFGDALLAAVIDEARTTSAIGVEGEALPGDRHTKNLYERAGIVARLIVTYKAL